jgi:hypothetical protein
MEWAAFIGGVVYGHSGLGNVFAAWSFVFPVMAVVTFLLFIVAAVAEKSGISKTRKPLKDRLRESRSIVPSWMHTVADMIITATLFYYGWFFCGTSFAVGTFLSWMVRGSIKSYVDAKDEVAP